MIKHVDLVLNLNQMHITSSKKLNFHYRYDSICNWFRNSRFHYLSCISVWCDNIAANFWFSWTNWCDEPIRKLGNTIRERNLLWLKVFNYPAPIFAPASGCDVPITFYALLLTGQAWSILSKCCWLCSYSRCHPRERSRWSFFKRHSLWWPIFCWYHKAYSWLSWRCWHGG